MDGDAKSIEALAASVIGTMEDCFADLDDLDRPDFRFPNASADDSVRDALVAALMNVPKSDERRHAAVYSAIMLLRSSNASDEAWFHAACEGLQDCPRGARARVEFLKLVVMHLRSVNAEAVIAATQEILEREPTNARAYEYLLEALFDLGLYDEAIETFARGNAVTWRGIHFQLNRVPSVSDDVARTLARLRRDGAFLTPDNGTPAAGSASIADLAVFGGSRFNFYALGDVRALADEGAPHDPAYVRLVSPFGKDRNHLNGVGIVDLVFSWEPAPLANPSKWTPSVLGTIRPMDLRGARLEIRYRPVGVNEKAFRAYIGITSHTPETTADGATAAGLWAFTRQPLAMHTDGWTTAVIDFSTDPDDWTYAGNNPDEQPDADRYSYADFERSLRANTGNVVVWFLSGDERDTPEGTIDLAWIRLSYANESVLAACNGAVLKQWPTESPSDPAVLTDGRIGDPAGFWVSSENRKPIQTFVWELAEEARIQEVRLFQNPAAPARDVVVKVSRDGKSFGTVSRVRMPPADPSRPGEGDYHQVLLDTPAVARFFRLDILSGQGGRRCGLDAVEAFAERA